jgi:hypothetical protein
VRTSWYCGIILSLFSILTAADQTVRLHRLSSHRDGLSNIRKLLSKTNGEKSHSSKTGRRKPSLLQIITWQMPVMFLTSATLCMIVGMFLHVWSATTHLHHPAMWDDNTKVRIHDCLSIRCSNSSKRSQSLIVLSLSSQLRYSSLVRSRFTRRFDNDGKYSGS